MKLYLSGHSDRYAMEQLQLCLFPEEPMEFCEEPFRGDGAVSKLSYGSNYLTATARITRGGVTTHGLQRLALDKESYALRRRILQRAYYLAALPHLPSAPPWGALSGVRPTKLTTRHLLAGGSPETADRLLEESFFVTPARRRLCVRASQASVEAAKLLAPSDVSVYIGIPFCPTRCAYCSFVSQTEGSAGKLLTPYLEGLLREIETVAAGMKKAGLGLRTLYIGGGTPTTLSAAQLRLLMETINRHFDRSRLIEYTVEAGRPDTVDPEKLRVIRALGADRVSINPQTMNDAVLRAVGRPHTAADVERAYAQAVEAGFESINMDLIAGLPGDDPASFAASLDRVLALDPSNITVHTLALKKGADLFSRREDLPSQAAVEEMVDHANELLSSRGYAPYYLYRQKYMSGSLENVGWCRDGDLGLYNIYMMEELSSILALGGGAVSKRNLPENRLERQCNPKYPKQYVERIDQVLAAKTALLEELTSDGKSGIINQSPAIK
ncbi:MAG: coproporphyrinogen dehydrogenase HemZ [Oscillospiraceae bacterium]|nr:coproporphyrinogen dehydrogenase HemZ [Oscillospiraceae bacterium]